MSTEIIETQDAPSEADRQWWAFESHDDDQGHDLDISTADIPGVESPDDDGPDMEQRAASAAWMDAYEHGWAAV